MPRSLPSSLYASPTATLAPSRSSARKCVSTRRRPMTSPPGGGRVTRPNRANIGPASRIDARISLHSAGSSGRGSLARVSTSTVFGPFQSTVAPTCCSSCSRVSTSRMRGTLSMRQGPSASNVAARIGRAAFLLPAGRIVPISGRPPVTRNDGGIGPPKLRARLRLRQAFANVGPRASSVRAGAGLDRWNRRDAADTPRAALSTARWHHRHGCAVRLARCRPRSRARRARCCHAAHSRSGHRARHRLGRGVVRCAIGMADAATHLMADLARRRCPRLVRPQPEDRSVARRRYR